METRNSAETHRELRLRVLVLLCSLLPGCLAPLQSAADVMLVHLLRRVRTGRPSVSSLRPDAGGLLGSLVAVDERLDRFPVCGPYGAHKLHPCSRGSSFGWLPEASCPSQL